MRGSKAGKWSIGDADADFVERIKTAASGAARTAARFSRDGSVIDGEELASLTFLAGLEAEAGGAGRLSDLGADLGAAKLLAAALGARAARAEARTLAAVKGETGVIRSDVRAYPIRDTAALDEVAVCERAASMCSGVFDPEDPASVDKARAVVGAIAGVPARLVRSEAGGVPITTAAPADYAARAIEWACVGGSLADLPWGPDGRLSFLSVADSAPVETAAAVHARGLADYDSAGWGHFRAGENVTADRARIMCQAVGRVCALLASDFAAYVAPTADELALMTRDKVSAGVSVMGLGADPAHLVATVREGTVKGSLTPPWVLAFIRSRESGAGHSVEDLTALSASDVLLSRLETDRALRAGFAGRAARTRGRGRPAVDVLGGLDVLASRCGLDGVGDESRRRLRLVLDGGAGLGSLTAADVLAFASSDDFDALDIVRNGKGQRVRRKVEGVNASAVSDALAAVGVKADSEAVKAGLLRFGADVRGAAVQGLTGSLKGRRAVLGGVSYAGDPEAVRSAAASIGARRRLHAVRSTAAAVRPWSVVVDAAGLAGLAEGRRYLAGLVGPVRAIGAAVVGPVASDPARPVEFEAHGTDLCSGWLWDVRPVGTARVRCFVKGPHRHYVGSGVMVASGAGLPVLDGDRQGQGTTQVVRLPGWSRRALPAGVQGSTTGEAWRLEHGASYSRLGGLVPRAWSLPGDYVAGSVGPVCSARVLDSRTLSDRPVAAAVLDLLAGLGGGGTGRIR